MSTSTLSIELSEEQTISFDKYIQGENIFITGPGGTGKSTLIKKILEHAKSRGKNIQVCALTGCAAVLLNCKAKTIHSWAGIGLGAGTIDSIVKKIIINNYKKKTRRKNDILIIDEVSMMSQKLFETLDKVGKATRQSVRPFGGIQLVFLGDFYQLPPIGDKEEVDTTKYCFESLSWNKIFTKENTIQLKKIFRQKDECYSKILNQIREGRLKKSSNELLLSLVKKETKVENENECESENNNDKHNESLSSFVPTKLFPTRNKVDAINEKEMNLLNTPEIEYKLKYIRDIVFDVKKEKSFNLFAPSEQDINKELNMIQHNLLCTETIKLKVGAQVMCIVNMEKSGYEMLCNGSQGIITRFSASNLPIVKYTTGQEVEMGYHVWQSDNIPNIGVSQIPLILAWAITIHKSQGATLQRAEIDVGNGIFECGQTYVAMSRVTSLQGLTLSSFDASKIYINKKVRDFYDSLLE